MRKWIGSPSDEWGFLIGGFYRGPITKAKLALYFDVGMLHPEVWVVHLSNFRLGVMGKGLALCVEEGEQYYGKCGVDFILQQHAGIPHDVS